MTYRNFIWIAALAVVVAVFIGSSMAFAQDGAPAVAPSSIWFDLWQILQPLVVLFFSIVGPVLVTWIGARLIGLLKITDQAKKLEVEVLLRDALHASAANAISYAVAKAGLAPGAGLTRQIIEDAATYVAQKNPETLAKLNVSENALRDIILSKVPGIASKNPA